MTDDAVEGGRDRGHGGGQGLRLFAQDRAERVGRRLAVERPLARDHLVEDCSQTEQIRATVHRLRAHLLRRHVADRSQHHAGARARGDGGVLAGHRPLVGPHQLGEAEVEDLDAAVPGQEEILGLQIPVDDALLVRRRETMRHLARDVDGLADRQRACLQAVAQRLALEQLRDDVRSPVLVADVVDGEDVRVVERRGGLRLLREASQAVGIGRNAGGKDLDGHVAAEGRVAGAVDFAHSAGAEGGHNLAGSESRAGCQGHRRRV